MSRGGKGNLESDPVDWSEKARDVSRMPFACEEAELYFGKGGAQNVSTFSGGTNDLRSFAKCFDFFRWNE